LDVLYNLGLASKFNPWSCYLPTATQNGSTHVEAKNNEHYVMHQLQKAQSTSFKKIP
jgi:hypothetical protein